MLTLTWPRRSVYRWLFWFAMLAMVGVVLLAFRSRLDKAHVALAFLLVVLGGSSAEGRALGLALAGTAFLVFDFFFLLPYNTLFIANPLDWLVLFVFLVTSAIAAQLLENQRHEAAVARRRALEIDRLAALGAETLNAPHAEDALSAIANVIRSAMATDRCDIYLRHGADGLTSGAPAGAGTSPEIGALSHHTLEHGQATAVRADGTLALIEDPFASRDAIHVGPSNLRQLRALDIPLSVRGGIVGVLHLSSEVPFAIQDDQHRVLGALAYYAALGAERVRLARAEQAAESLRQSDRLKDALLASVSHDLRTPLTAIKAIANEIWHGADPMRAVTIEEEADRLGALVSDLLELSQLNAGAMPVDAILNTADDVVGAALERVEAVHGPGRIEVDMLSDGEILVGRFDFGHTMRALTNLLENAIKYSPPDSAIRLRVARAGDRLRFTVEDFGAGVAPRDASRIFEAFFRGSIVPDGVRGTGLGLSIARELAEAQGGSLSYEAREGGGSRFVLDLRGAALLEYSAIERA